MKSIFRPAPIEPRPGKPCTLRSFGYQEYVTGRQATLADFLPETVRAMPTLMQERATA